MTEGIEDAEWEEVPRNKGSLRVQATPSKAQYETRTSSQPPEPSPWLSGEFWRNTLRTGCFGLIALVGIVVVASMLNRQSQPEPGRNEASSGDAPMLTKEWLSGNWVMTPKGGGDGKTSCDDFNVAALYNLNGSTAKLLSFGIDGKYRSLFAYTTPSGDEHTQFETADWSIDGDTISRRNVMIDNSPFGGHADDDAAIAHAADDNVLTIDNQGTNERYVRCVGSVDEMFPTETVVRAPPSSDYSAQSYQPDLDELCSDQETINNLVMPFRSVVGQILLGQNLNSANMNEETLFRAWVIGDRMKKSNFRFLNIRNAGVEGLGTGTITVRCRANLRLVEPLDETNGAFSTYLQFNDARYSVRIKNANSNNPESYFLAEIRPTNGQWDVTSGTE